MSLKPLSPLAQKHFEHDSGAGFGTSAGARQSAPLEYNAKCFSPPPDNDLDVRAERYRLQGIARDIFITDGFKKKLHFPANRHKTAHCLHTRIAENVSVMKSKKHGKAFYNGLIVCGNVWTCPVCAAKIQERRRLEVAQAFDWAYDTLHKKVIMVTFTFPHYAHNRLKTLLKQQSGAFAKFRAGKAWSKKKAAIGFEGLIRSLELTLGANGWHPHTHEAWIVDKDCDVADLQAYIALRWFDVCKKVGLVTDDQKSDFLKRSVDIKDNCHTSEYLAKMDDTKNWGMDRELVKASSKIKTCRKGMHPFGLLADAGREEGEREREDSAFRFLEYSDAMKGKAQLFWSQRLKERVGINDKSDEEIALEQEDKADLLSDLSPHQWKIVVRKKARAQILKIAESEGKEGMMRWLAKHEESTEGDYSDVAPISDQRAEFKKAQAISAKAAKRKQEILLNEKLDAILLKAKVEMSPASAFTSG